MIERINRLRERMNDVDAVLITGYPNIFYYSGFKSEDAYLLITHDRQYIVTDSRYTIQAKEQAPDFELCDISRGLKEIAGECTNIGYEDSFMTVGEYNRLQKSVGIEFVPCQDIISASRKQKDKSEIKKVAEAERLGDEAFLHILKFIKSGVREREVALELEFFMKKNGASALSFDTIVASGKRSAMPHGLASDKIIENGDLVTLDFGCVLDGYCSDMTRTVAIGSISDECMNIYNTVLKAQLAALDFVTIGKKCSDVDMAARQVIQDAGYGECFGHALGHGLGIQIHEAPTFSKKCEEEVKEGHIITVEPGIYVEGLGGVRIEDVIAIENGKVINLTKSEKELIIL